MNKTKHIWVFLSAYGIFFALLSWIQDMVTRGLWWKGALAVILGFTLYKTVVNKI